MSRCVFLIFAFFCFASFVCVISVAILLSNAAVHRLCVSRV